MRAEAGSWNDRGVARSSEVAAPASRRGEALRAVGLPAVAAALFATVFVVRRVVSVESGDVSGNVLIGRLNAPGRVPGDLSVLSGPGYDGQFYYRLAVDPFHLDGLTNGIRIDSPVRLQRIGYPFLSWLLSGGQSSVVPFALVLVNVLAVGALAGLGAALACSYGRAPAWGLLFGVFSGFVVTLARDLTELLAAALVVGALLALRRERPVTAGIVLAGAVLTRETALILPVAVLLASLRGGRWRAGFRPRRADLVWLLPVIAYVLWQGAVRLLTGHLPARAEHDNLSVPLVAAARSVAKAFGQAPLHDVVFVFAVAALVILVVIVVLAAARRPGRVPRPVLYAFGLSTVLTASLSRNVWNGDAAELRTFMDVHLFGVAALMAAPPRYLVAYGVVTAAPFVLAVVYYSGSL